MTLKDLMIFTGLSRDEYRDLSSGTLKLIWDDLIPSEPFPEGAQKHKLLKLLVRRVADSRSSSPRTAARVVSAQLRAMMAADEELEEDEALSFPAAGEDDAEAQVSDVGAGASPGEVDSPEPVRRISRSMASRNSLSGKKTRSSGGFGTPASGVRDGGFPRFALPQGSASKQRVLDLTQDAGVGQTTEGGKRLFDVEEVMQLLQAIKGRSRDSESGTSAPAPNDLPVVASLDDPLGHSALLSRSSLGAAPPGVAPPHGLNLNPSYAVCGAPSGLGMALPQGPTPLTNVPVSSWRQLGPPRLPFRLLERAANILVTEIRSANSSDKAASILEVNDPVLAYNNITALVAENAARAAIPVITFPQEVSGKHPGYEREMLEESKRLLSNILGSVDEMFQTATLPKLFQADAILVATDETVRSFYEVAYAELRKTSTIPNKLASLLPSNLQSGAAHDFLTWPLFVKTVVNRILPVYLADSPYGVIDAILFMRSLFLMAAKYTPHGAALYYDTLRRERQFALHPMSPLHRSACEAVHARFSVTSMQDIEDDYPSGSTVRSSEPSSRPHGRPRGEPLHKCAKWNLDAYSCDGQCGRAHLCMVCIHPVEHTLRGSHHDVYDLMLRADKFIPKQAPNLKGNKRKRSRSVSRGRSDLSPPRGRGPQERFVHEDRRQMMEPRRVRRDDRDAPTGRDRPRRSHTPPRGSFEQSGIVEGSHTQH